MNLNDLLAAQRIKMGLEDKKAAPVVSDTTRSIVGNLVTDASTGYGRKALLEEIERVRGAVEGERNDTLFASACNLLELVNGGQLVASEVQEALEAAGDHIGLDHGEIALCLSSATKRTAEKARAPDPFVAGDPFSGLDVDPATGVVTDQEPTDAAEALSAIIRKNLPVIDWHALWADDSDEEWIIEPLLPARRLVALYSAPKVGKSLLLLELCVAVATGRDVLGVSLDRPRNVLYVDFENDPKADVRERLQAMKVGPDDLQRLFYLSFPTLAALDSDRGGQELMHAVAEYECEVVVVDTVSRSIQGEENENDTWLNFYRHTGLRMKQAGVALIRLDHSGKDETKGQRGGSAKSGDVDAVWRLSRITDDSYRLDCEAARMPIAEKTLVLHREQLPYLRHRVDAEGRTASWRIKIEAVVKVLDALGLPDDTGSTVARRELRSAGQKASNDVLAEALKRRQNRSESASDRWSE